MYYLLVLCINLALKSFQFIDCTLPFVFFITPKILSLSITHELKIYIYMVLRQPIQQLWIFTPLPMVGAFPKMIHGPPFVITAQNVLLHCYILRWSHLVYSSRSLTFDIKSIFAFLPQLLHSTTLRVLPSLTLLHGSVELSWLFHT